MPLHYILIFPYGTPGWGYNMLLTTPSEQGMPAVIPAPDYPAHHAASN
jgi:hypothetical protein